MKEIIIKSQTNKKYCISLIEKLAEDGSVTVAIKKTNKDSTAAQRNLQWLWYTEVAASGLGRDDTKEGVHITAKWMFARPILLRDNGVFGAIYEGFSVMVQDLTEQDRKEFWREFTEYYISTEQMSRQQRAEYLREFEMYWRGKGVELTSPEMQGLDQYLGAE